MQKNVPFEQIELAVAIFDSDIPVTIGSQIYTKYKANWPSFVEERLNELYNEFIATMKLIFTMPNLLILYWTMFWLMNELDKFLYSTDIGIITWEGKDRHEQFRNYFSNTEIPESWIYPLLHCIGIWEIAISIPLFAALWIQFLNLRPNGAYFNNDMLFGTLTFIIFSFFDIIFGDRAELLEHGIYLILICVTYHLALNYETTAYTKR